MKPPLLALAALCLFAPVLPAQVVDSSFGKHVNTLDDLQKNITAYPYTWEIADGKTTVKFNADGTGKQAFFSFTWRALDPLQIEVNNGTAKTTFKFNANYTAYDGVDFDGSRPIHGVLVLPQPGGAATPTPPPSIAAATPPQRPAVPAPAAPLASNNPPAGGPGAPPPAASNTVPTPRPSNSFFDHLQTSPSAGNDAIANALTNNSYTWEHRAISNPQITEGDGESMTFLPNGEGKQSFWQFNWRVKSAHEIEITQVNDPKKRKAVLKFSNDFSKYTAVDLDGSSPLSGHKLPAKE